METKADSDDARTASTVAPDSTAEPDEFAPIADDGWNTDERCPWCKKLIEELYSVVGSDGDDYRIQCPHCEQPIVASEWRQYVLQKPRNEGQS